MRAPLHDIREAKHVEQPCCKFAEQRGWLQRKVGDDGWPDRIFIRDGKTVWWEFKVPVGGVLSPKQKIRIRELNDHGAEVHFGGDVQHFKRVMW